MKTCDFCKRVVSQTFGPTSGKGYTSEMNNLCWECRDLQHGMVYMELDGRSEDAIYQWVESQPSYYRTMGALVVSYAA